MVETFISRLPTRADSAETWSGFKRPIISSILLVALFVVLTIMFVWPAIMLVVGVFRTSAPGTPGEWSLGALRQGLNGSGTLGSIFNSTILAAFTAVAGTIVASGFAFLSERTDVPFRRLIVAAMLVMYATPPLFYAVGYGLLANKYTGLLNIPLHTLFGPSVTINIESWPGLLLVVTFREVAFLYLFLIGPFRALDTALTEAAHSCGASRLQTLLRIEVPILAPALTGAIILGAVGGLHVFATALIIAEPGGIRLISTQIYDFLVGAFPPRYADASLLSVLLIAGVGVFSLIQGRLLGGRSFVTVSGKSRRQEPISLGRWRPVAAIAVLAYIFVAQALPIASLIYSSLQQYPGVYGSLTLEHYARLLAKPQIADAMRTTALLAAFVGLSAMAAAMVLAQVERGLDRFAASFLRLATLIPHAMPGIVVALAMIWAYVSVPGLRALYGTFWLLIIALVIVILPIATQIAMAATAQIAPELQEAALTCGASRLRVLFDIVGRLIAPSILSGWYIVAVSVAGNLDIPLLLGWPGLNTVATQVFLLNTQSRFGDAAALLIALLTGLLVVAAAGLFLCRWASVSRPRHYTPHNLQHETETLSHTR